jgi:hypothetical protein
MSFIADSRIQIKYTDIYRTKLVNNSLSYPMYFSLIDDEINYNLINQNDGLIGNEGFENNLVEHDLDYDVLSLPVLEPSDITYSKLYGYWDLDPVIAIEQIGAETKNIESEYSKFKKYILDVNIINRNNIYWTGEYYDIKYNFANLYKDMFNVQCNNKLYFFDGDKSSDIGDGILESFTGGEIDNTYNLYRNLVVNRDNSEKQLSASKLLNLSSQFDSSARGYMTIIDKDNSYFPTHKVFLHIHSDFLKSSKVIDMTNSDLKTSKIFPMNVFNIYSILNNDINFYGSVDVSLYFETMFKINISGVTKLMRSKSETLKTIIELQK